MTTGPDRRYDLHDHIIETQPNMILSVHVYQGSRHGEAYLIALCSNGIWQQRMNDGYSMSEWKRLEGPPNDRLA